MSMMALPCPNKGCTELVYLNKMEAHMETCKFRLQPCPNKERGCKVTLPAKVGFCQCSPHSALHINSQSPHIKPCLQDICWHMKQCSLNGGQPPPPIRKLSIPKNTERRHSIKGSANSLKVQVFSYCSTLTVEIPIFAAKRGRGTAVESKFEQKSGRSRSRVSHPLCTVRAHP